MKKEPKLFTPSQFARRHNVKPSRITVLKDKLKTKPTPGGWAIVNCEENDKLMDNPSPRRGKKMVVKGKDAS